MFEHESDGEVVHAFSGIDAQTGDYLHPGLCRRTRQPKRPVRGVRFGVEPEKLDETGWAVVFGPDVTPDVRAALRPLLDRRREQAGRLYREVEWQRGERRARTFLDNHGAPIGDADPARFPYHVLLVGSPAHLPFAFQSGFSPDYSVGRLHFATPQEYRAYAATVIDHEERQRATPRVAVFAPSHAHDPAAEMSSGELAAPLVRTLRQRLPGWQVEPYLRGAATRARLMRLLGEDTNPPDLLFTAGHGLHFRSPEEQARAEGALICAEWPGARAPRRRSPHPEEYVSADQLDGQACPQGAIVFHMACNSAGTRPLNWYEYWAHRRRVRVTERAFVAPLPQRLLGRRGGALAVVGHVDAALLDPLIWPHRLVNVGDFEDVLLMLAAGHPVGTAMEIFGRRYASFGSAALELGESRDLLPLKRAPRAPDLHLARNDARGYVVLGDPAVRLKPASARRKRVLRGGGDLG